MNFSLLPTSFRRTRRVPVILQSESSECGLACLAMLRNYHGIRVNLRDLRLQHPTSARGLALAQLLGIADDIGLSARALRVDLGDLCKLRTPCILHWNMDHFVVLLQRRRRGAVIIDPASGRRSVTEKELDRSYTGIAVEAMPNREFKAAEGAAAAPPDLRLRDFVCGQPGLLPAWMQILTLSIALQVFALVTPFYLQLVIDDVAVSADRDLLFLLGLAFTFLTLFSTATAGLRSWLVVVLSSSLNYAWCGALFRHLVALPYEFFEKRHLGDIQSRFKSVHAVQNLLASQTVQILVDGMMALTTLLVMYWYNVALASIVLASLLIHAGLRASLLAPQRRATLNRLGKSARSDTHFLESVRGIVALRNFNREQQRERDYRDRLADEVAAGIDEGRWSVLIDAAGELNAGLQSVAVIWLGAAAVIDGNMSVGMLIAFLAYRMQFSMKGHALIDRCSQLQLIRAHLERLSDIAGAVPERRPLYRQTLRLRGSVVVRDLWFRYGDNEPFVLSGTSFAIAEGEQVAITGPSGAGKTTLLKLMIGLDRPQRGAILIDGRSLAGLDLQNYRRQIGTVMQDDHLFAGSLLENISFFALQPDIRRAEACCEIAGIAADVAAMPMGFHTRVGDMGDVLSGGQRQRVLLARALYHRPRILYLDEATSHLDPATESHAVSALSALQMTRIVIAHRSETVRQADRVIRLERSG